MFMDHVSVLVVAEGSLDVETHQVECDAFVEPTIGPLLSCDKAAVKLLR